MHKTRAISKKIMGVGVALLIMAQLLPTAVWAQGNDIPIDENNFPDQNFRTYVKAETDKNNDNKLSADEIGAAEFFHMQNMEITSLKGIEYFTELTKLYCPGNKLKKMDLTRNTKLVELDCGGNHLLELDLSQNTALTSLVCYDNGLMELDLRANKALTNVNIRDNGIFELDTSACGGLKKLLAANNDLTQLDLSGNPALEYLECAKNRLTKLNVTKNAELVKLECYENQLRTLDLSGNPKLEILYCDNNDLTDLDLSANKALKELYFRHNSLYTLNISECGALQEVFGGYNHLTSLDLAKGVNPHNLNLPENSYQLDQREDFDCSRLPGKFDINRVIRAVGGRFDKANNTFSFEEGQNSAVYTYDAGNGEQVDFRLTAEPHNHTFSPDWTKDAIHHWHAATCEHKDKVSDMAQHTFGEWKVQQEPTAEKEGVQIRACDVCGFEESKTIPVVTPKPTEQPVEPTAPSESAPETTTPSESTQATTAPSESTQGTAPSKPATPNTGDSSSMMMWIGVLVVCGVVVLVIVFSSKKKK